MLQPDIANTGGMTELKKIAIIAEAKHISMAPHDLQPDRRGRPSSTWVPRSRTSGSRSTTPSSTSRWFFELCPRATAPEWSLHPSPEWPGLGITLNEEIARAHPLEARRGWGERGI